MAQVVESQCEAFPVGLRLSVDPIVPCVVLSGEDFPRCLPHTGPVKAGETPILTCGTEE